MIDTVYVKADSKRALNRRLADERITGTSYTPWDVKTVELNDQLPKGTVIKIYTKIISGSPYAKAYGNWNPAKRRVD